MKYLTIKY